MKDAHARVIRAETRELGSDTPTELPPQDDQQRENGCAPGRRANEHPGTSCTPRGHRHREEAEVDSIPRQADNDSQARVALLLRDLERLRGLLADAIAAREGLVTANIRLYEQSRHWFIDDGEGYCLACNCVEKNSRHVRRSGAAA